jgi:flagellar hook-associated protein 2
MATSSVSSSLGGTYGLSGSGVDVDAIVKKLMTGQQSVDDGLAQQKTVLQWQKAAYNTVYDDINTFRNTVFNYKLQATLSPNKVSSSNTSVATATANAGAADVNHSLIVGRLASGVNLTSAGSISTGAKDTIASQLYNGITPTGSMKVTIANGSASATITIDPSKSINDLVSQINNSTGLNVTASYDSTLDRFFLSTTNTGSSSEIKITDATVGDTSGTSFFTSKLQLASLDNKGQDAAFKLDGADLTETSNTFTISGVTYNLTGVTSGATAATVAGVTTVSGGEASSISVTNDVDTAVASIQTLVDSYNKILDELNSKVKETRYTDYPPLTDAQKASMKDTDITAWNVKAQSGMLHNDNTLSILVSTIRNAIASPVSGITGSKYNSGSSIGITTSDYTEGGKLYLDKDKLKTALNANPNVLNQLFGATGTVTATDGTTTTDFKSQGIAGRLYDGIKTAMDKLNTIAGTTANAQYDASSNIAKSIISYNTQITDATAKFTMMQKMYYTQYNAMEVALQSLTSQSSWITSQLSSSSG